MNTKEYFDLSKETWKGCQEFNPTQESVRANKGKMIIYVLRRDVDFYRGIFTISSNEIEDMKYKQIIFENQDSIDVRDLVACIINMEEDSGNNEI